MRLCNVLEEDIGEIEWERVDGGVDVKLGMRPFELLSVKVTL